MFTFEENESGELQCLNAERKVIAIGDKARDMLTKHESAMLEHLMQERASRAAGTTSAIARLSLLSEDEAAKLLDLIGVTVSAK